MSDWPKFKGTPYELETGRKSAELLIWHIEAGLICEPERARIHALTRKVTVTDEEILNIRRGIESDWSDGATLIDLEADTAARARVGKGPRRNWFDAMCDLRDRYEERGKYAITSQANQAPSTQSQQETSKPNQSNLSDQTTDEKA